MIGRSKRREAARKVQHIMRDVAVINAATAVDIGAHQALTKLFTGQKMYVDTRDISLVPHLLTEGLWEPEFTNIFLEWVTPNSVVFDIGANFGYFGLIAAKDMTQLKARGHVYFFEANPHLTPFMFKSVVASGVADHATIVNAAVADISGTVELTIPESLWGSASIELYDRVIGTKFDIGMYDRVTIPTVTIDEYAKTHAIKSVDVIKMDIEGYEEKAYQGMQKLVARSPRLALFIEFTDDAYKNSSAFFAQLQRDFGHVYALADTKLQPLNSYRHMKELMTDSWIMLLASKQPAPPHVVNKAS